MGLLGRTRSYFILFHVIFGSAGVGVGKGFGVKCKHFAHEAGSIAAASPSWAVKHAAGANNSVWLERIAADNK